MLIAKEAIKNAKNIFQYFLNRSLFHVTMADDKNTIEIPVR